MLHLPNQIIHMEYLRVACIIRLQKIGIDHQQRIRTATRFPDLATEL